MAARMLSDEHGEMYALAVRLGNSLTALIRPICEAMHLVPPEEKSAVVEGLRRIYRKIHCPVGDQGVDEVISVGRMTQVLAGDLAFLLQKWHKDDAPCAAMIVRLEEDEQNLAVMLNEVRQWRSNLNNV